MALPIPTAAAAAATTTTNDDEEAPDLVPPSAAAVAAAAARASAAVVAGISLQLTPEEETLFSALTQCVRDKQLNIELRAAGGWVRDKLLGIPSKDIDIAIDTTTGARFADILNEWLCAHGKCRRSFGVIAKRAAQSKHLETATLSLFSFSLDMVNLRSECYCSSSRIPNETRLGTPLEDAERRDFCCNSLFFNLHSRFVEDWLGRGLQDIQRRILRASHPHPPTTLAEDPLRLLRAIRFAAALGFQLEKGLAAASAAPEIHEAVRAKVARERVGIEIKKIFSIVHHTPKPTAAAAAAAAAAAKAAAPAEAASGVKIGEGEELLEGPLDGALRGLLLLQQLNVWETVTALPEGHEVYRHPDGDSFASLGAPKIRGGLKAFAEHLKATQKPVSVKEVSPFAGPLGVSCLIGLRHLLARRPLLQKLQQQQQPAAAAAAADTAELYKALSQGLNLKAGEDRLRQLLFAAVLSPLRCLLAVSPGAPRVRPLAGALVFSSWKLPTADAVATEGLIAHAAQMRAAADEEATLQQQQQQQQQQQRVRLGMLIGQVGPQWRDALLLAAAEALGALICKDTAAAIAAASAEITGGDSSPAAAAAAAAAETPEQQQPAGERKRSSGAEGPHDQKKICGPVGAPGRMQPHPEAPHASAAAGAAAEEDEVAPEVSMGELDCLLLSRGETAKETLRRLLRLREIVEALGLQDVWALQPLCNGKQVIDVLPLASGPKLGEIMQKQRIWQLANPLDSPEECLAYLKEEFRELCGVSPKENGAPQQLNGLPSDL